MTAHDCLSPPVPKVQAEAPLPEVLTALRFHAMACRSSARLDLFEACQVLAPDPKIAADAYGIALVRTLPHALNRGVHLRRPGAEPNFDEIWLMRVIERSKHQDDDSLSFLIMSRVPDGRRHAFLHLVNGLARTLREAAA
ncbi:MAG: hypothetical protein CSA72_07240 [Rhodobacterales bacterium]|nr:MAG: hypothetical protein CSA72_07240 [Rhodobacterales bacterium]